jgi:formate--tetrahydrofolate ligase
MHVLLADAIEPNLVQTREGGPALVHGGPFANIAHGCSSVVATRLGLAHADVVVTEAGFGFDLGGEKFLHLKCRQAGLWPSAVVLVATVRALASHGGGGPHDHAALERGLAHLDGQIENVRAFGLTPVVATNVFPDDTEAALSAIAARCGSHGVEAVRATVFRDGGAGGESLARAVADVLDSTTTVHSPRFLYELESEATAKIEKIATTIYGADGVAYTDRARKDLEALAKSGHGRLPVCVAKTQLSFTDDPGGGATKGGFRVTVTSVRLSAGAGFLVVLMGDMQTMPGFPREPAALRIKMLPDGTIQGLMQNE